VTLAALIKKGGLHQLATVATAGDSEKSEEVARVATIAVALINPLKLTFGTDREKHKGGLEESATAIPATAATDNVEQIVAAWRALVGLKLDPVRVREHLANLKKWKSKFRKEHQCEQ
jgi:hypothetical protein